MKKRIIAIVLVFLLCVAGGYYVAGMRAETVLKKMVMDANLTTMRSLRAQNSPLEVNYRLTNYKNHFLVSSADLDVSIKVLMPVNFQGTKGSPGTMPPMQMPAFSYNIPISIQHGPFIFKEGKLGLFYASASLKVPPKLQGMLQQFVGKDSVEPMVNFSALSRYNGNTTIDVSIPPFNLDSPMMQAKLNWLGFDNHWETDSGFSKMKGESTLSGLNVEMQGKSVNLKTLIANYNLFASSSPGVWLGNVSVSLPKVNISENGETLFSFGGGTMTSTTNESNGLLAGNATLKFSKAQVMNESYGPGEFKTHMKNLDLNELAVLQKKANELNAPGLSQTERQKKLQVLLPNLFRLAQKAPQFTINKLSLVLPEGNVDGTGSVRINAKGTAFKEAIDVAKAVVLNANLSVPKALVRKATVNMISQKLTQKQFNDRQQQKEVLSSEANSSQEQEGMVSDKPASQQPMLSEQEIQKLAESQADQQIGSLVKAGLLTDKNENYFVHLELKGNNLMVNGKLFKEGVFQ